MVFLKANRMEKKREDQMDLMRELHSEHNLEMSLAYQKEVLMGHLMG